MSWMDSWSRPSKHAATPPPLYLTQGDTVPYCHSCGRVISSRRTQSSPSVKYCSDRCKHHKPGALDRKIEDVFVALLNGLGVSVTHHDTHTHSHAQENDAPSDGQMGAEAHKAKEEKQKDSLVVVVLQDDKKVKEEKERRKRKVKGDPRITVMCNEVEEIVFGDRHDPTKVYGRKKNRATRVIGGVEDKEWKSVDMEDGEDDQHPQAEEKHEDKAAGAATEEDTFDEESLDGRSASGSGGVPVGAEKEHVHSELGASGRIRPPQTRSEVNFSVGGERGWAEKIEETPEMAEKRRMGQRRAEEKEMVRRAARRGCAFGFVDGGLASGGLEGNGEGNEKENVSVKGKVRKKKDGGGVVVEEGKGVGDADRGKLGGGGKGGKNEKERRRKCEAVMREQVVEASFAKGEFGIRWREGE